ncbi:MAG: hypothetical protein EOP39_10600 [Rubrivivax sp.]|nr:MAG: hypothetical protein EOP39_10600 [Rubrivivax sp.]
MADFSTLIELPAPAAAAANLPLLMAVSRFWAPASAPAQDPEVGYESALPWMLDDTARPHAY